MLNVVCKYFVCVFLPTRYRDLHTSSHYFNTCSGGVYNTPECDYNVGKCVNITMPADNYPNCYATRTLFLGNGICNGVGLNSEECGFDGGDCNEFNEKYPGCLPWYPKKIGDGNCDIEYNTTECKYDGFDCINSTVLYQYGEVVSLEGYRADTKTFTAVQITFSTISFLASIAILIIIKRRHEGLSTTINRLLFGLCVSDVLSSFFQCLGTLPTPKEYADVIWNASGNVASCEAQGFFIFVGSIAAPLYNCSLCFYYLAVLKYNKKDEYIKEKIEPFLHAVPILFSLIGGFTILGLKAFNPNKTYCFIGPDPTSDDVDCDRIKDSNILFYIFSAAPYIILPSVIGITMTVIYRVVLVQEKKLEKYGIGGLRKNTTKKTPGTTDAEENTAKEVQTMSIKTILRKFVWKRKNETVALRKKKKQSRVVLNTALSYSIAFLLSYLLPLVISIRTLSSMKSGFALSILARILFPLQGFFNFCVFLYPLVTTSKRKHKNISWFSAFLTALMSRGPKRKVSRSLKSGGRQSTALTILSQISSKFKSIARSISVKKIRVPATEPSTNMTTRATSINRSPPSVVAHGISSNVVPSVESTTKKSTTVPNVGCVNEASELHPNAKSTVEKIESVLEQPGLESDVKASEDEELGTNGNHVVMNISQESEVEKIETVDKESAQQATPAGDSEDPSPKIETVVEEPAQQLGSAGDDHVERNHDVEAAVEQSLDVRTP